jgi:hypothetical protein
MPLIACPDCARAVSSEAPACIHCGRPMGTSSSPANLAGRPTAGIATALVLGVLTILWVLLRDPASSREMQDANALFNALTVAGNAVLLILALLSLWGQRWAPARIRGLSAAMIIGLCGISRGAPATTRSWRGSCWPARRCRRPRGSCTCASFASRGFLDRQGPFIRGQHHANDVARRAS